MLTPPPTDTVIVAAQEVATADDDRSWSGCSPTATFRPESD
jgi:hypothetical protein